MNVAFNIWDYLVLAVYMLSILGIATLFVKEQHNLKDFFVASRSVPWWAVGMSILATLVSAVSITGAPAEFYQYGFQGFGIWWLATFLAAPVIVFLFIRFFVGQKLTTAYEYLERRFALPIRLVASVFFMLIRGLYIGVVLYASAIVLRPAIGGHISLGWLIVLAGLFSTAFAVLGGMKAVIWTDAVQLVVVYVGIAWLVISVFMRIDGGMPAVWDIAVSAGKDFSYLEDLAYWSLDPFVRTAFWPLLIGFFFNAVAQKGSDQLTVQRYLSTASVKDSVKALMVDILGAVPVGLLLTGVGLCLFAFYHQNPDLIDLEQTGMDGIMPHYIVTQFPHGLAGLMIAAIVAAIVSTVDSGFNCLATVTMVDFQLRFRREEMSSAKSVKWARFWTLFWGAVCTGLALLINATATENVARLSTQVLGLFSGALLAVFLLGMLVPRANSWGAGIGAVVGALVTIWVNYGVVKTMPDGSQIHVCFTIPIIVGVVVTFISGWLLSYLFPPPRSEQLEQLTWKYRFSGAGN